MPSHFGWIDFSEEDREKMMDVVRLFQEQEARDELGIGTMRDAFSDFFFPGTSTIQTRARYFLFIPWTYRALESKGISSAKVANAARNEEVRLITALLESDDTDGVFGKESGSRLQRLPSAVYWAGLRAWGSLQFAGSQDQYHRSLDSYYRGRKSLVLGDDREPVTGPFRENWHPGIPKAPDGFPGAADLVLRREEALYLQERVVLRHGDSLLAKLVQHPQFIESDYLWEHPVVPTLSEKVQAEIRHARNFSLLLSGVNTLYNVLLSRAIGSEDWINAYEGQFEDWVDEMEAEMSGLRDWYREIAAFWSCLSFREANITSRTRSFINEWYRLVFEASDLHSLAQDSRVEQLIRDRERLLKGNRARLTNRRALQLWGGSAGARRLVFRWPNVMVLLRDIHAGLEREGDGSAQPQ